MLVPFKKVTLQSRVHAIKRKELDKMKKENEELDKTIAEQNKDLAEQDKIIAELNKTSKGMIRKWLGDKIVSEEKLDETPTTIIVDTQGYDYRRSIFQ